VGRLGSEPRLVADVVFTDASCRPTRIAMLCSALQINAFNIRFVAVFIGNEQTQTRPVTRLSEQIHLFQCLNSIRFLCGFAGCTQKITTVEYTGTLGTRPIVLLELATRLLMYFSLLASVILINPLECKGNYSATVTVAL